MQAHSLYVHIPFCRHRCGYCDFNTFAGQEDAIPAYMQALQLEMRKVARSAPQRFRVHTIFFGGGTPSIIPTDLMAQTMGCIRQEFDVSANAEVTLEANPGTVSLPGLTELHQMGFNRVSFGMQSARPEELRLLERQHSYFDVVEAVRMARQAGFANLSLDLIFNLPAQSLPDWQASVDLALALKPEHLSLYTLTIEEGTPLHHLRQKGLIAEPEDDLAADMYDWAGERLAQAGFDAYEISNWARRDPQGQLYSCRHNLQYWQAQPYFGFGAGAHAYLGDHRLANVRGIRAYIRFVNGREAGFPYSPATVDTWPVDQRTEMQEMMMLGLRLVQAGVRREAFARRFGMPLDEIFGDEIRELIAKGLLEDDGERLRLTHRARFIANQVFLKFVGD